MGLGIVLIVYFVVLSAAAICASALLAFLTYLYLKNVPAKRAKFIAAIACLPFACVAYAGMWFVGYALINVAVFHHDPMIGDGWYTDIGNGYAIDMIDVTDHGIVHPVSGPDRGLNSPEGISGVRRMQVVGTSIYGSEDDHIFENFGSGKVEEDAFFIIDTKTHVTQKFPNESDLALYAKQNDNTVLALQPIEDVYRKYRMNWFEPVAGVVLVVPPGLALVWLLRRVVRLKRRALTLSQPAA